MTRISKSFVDKVSAPKPKENGTPTQVFYRDSTLPGFGLRVTSGGTKSYIVETRIGKKVKRKTLGRHGIITAEQARKQAIKFLGQVACGTDPIAEEKREDLRKVTLKEAFDDYLQCRKNLKPGTVKDYRRVLNEVFADWQDKPLTKISKDMVEARHAKHGKRSPARANNAMRVLRAVFNHAIYKFEDDQGHPILEINPVDRLNRNRAWFEVKRRQTLIKPHQLSDWYEGVQQINETTRDYLLLLLLTGLRRSEATGLTWEQIDFTDCTLTVTDTKNGRPHTLPLTDRLLPLLLRRHEERQSEWVFPSCYGNGPLTEPRTAVDKVGQLSEVKFTLHDLRRTFITIAESLDIPSYALKRLLNHIDPNDVTAGYIISNVERLREPMQKITDFMWHNLTHKQEAKIVSLPQRQGM